MKVRRFLIGEDAGAMDADQIRMTEIKLFDNSNRIKSKIAKWAESMGAAFIKDYLPYNVVIEDKYTEEVMQAFQHDIDGTGESNFYFKDSKTGKLHREKPKEAESFKELSEGGTTTGGGYWAGEDADGNASGALGPAAGEDPPPGHGYLGYRYRRGDYDNRLTNYNTIWRVDDGEDFIWDWFPMCAGQEDYKNFSDTIDKVGEVFPEETWNNVVKKMTNVPKRLRSSRFSVLKGQPYRTSDNTLGDHPEDQQGGTETADVPKELTLEDSKINKYLGETTWTGMGDEAGNAYPDDGSGVASDDDRPPGNIVFAPRYERGDYFNKLTPYNTIWRHDEKGGWTWDWFENATGQDDPDNYNKTLQKMEKLFPEDTWRAAWSAVRKREVPSKEVDIRFGDKGQPYRKSDDVLGKVGSQKSAKVPKELDSDDKGVTNEMSMLDRIDKLLIDGCKKKKKKLTESTVAKTILKQINAIDKWALQSWGAKNYVSSDKSIQFDVRGSKFRGRVIITYDRGPDTYVVELGQVKNLDWKQKYIIKSIFAQDLVNVLDQQIG